MIQATYQQLIERISRLSGLELNEIQRRVEAKKAKLSGLISDEGAAQVVAAELGISFDKQKFKIIDLLIGMKKIQVVGKVLEIYPIRKYKRAEHEGEIGSMLIADETSAVRVVLWDTNHIELIKNNTIQKDSVIEIKNADVRGTTAKEIHLNSTSEISLSDAKIEKIKIELEKPRMAKLSELKNGEQASIRGNIVQLFQPAFFSVCPECNMKVSFEGNKAVCVRHGAIIPSKRAILNMVIDDGSDNIRAMAFSENIAKFLKISDDEVLNLENPQFFLSKKAELLGTEWIFSGRSRKNILFNRSEFVINSLQESQPEEIIKELSE
ncbi:MAG: hypothetical protein ACPLXC_00740 [Candidatus Pacearchaeota archaeon]